MRAASAILALGLCFGLVIVANGQQSGHPRSRGNNRANRQQTGGFGVDPGAKKCVAVVGGAATFAPGYIYTTQDSGETWTQRKTDSRGKTENWVTVASDDTGSKLAAIKENYGSRSEGGIYISDNSGSSWTRIDYHDPSRHHLSTSSDGNVFASMAAPDDSRGRFIYVSTQRGDGWASYGAGRNWSCGALSNDASRLVAVEYGGYIYTSSNLGRSLSSRTAAGARSWSAVTSSATGSSLAAAARGGSIWTSTDAGATWTEQKASGQRLWSSVASSADGTKLVAVATNDKIYVSNDGGKTWAAAGKAAGWTSVAATSDFKLLVAVARDDQIYVSKDGGKTWAAKGTTQGWSAVACQA